MRLLAIPLALVVLVASGWAWERHGRIADEHALSAVASELAGARVRVECQSFWADLVNVGGNIGDVPYVDGHAAPYTHLTRGVCSRLHRFRSAGSHPELACLLAVDWSRWSWAADAAGPCAQRALPTLNALVALTHESMHMRGWLDEATAQCYALQEVAWTVVRLGGSLAEGRAVARLGLAMSPGMPAEYQSRECGPGGQLDLHAETAAFPTEDDPGPPQTYGPSTAR